MGDQQKTSRANSVIDKKGFRRCVAVLFFSPDLTKVLVGVLRKKGKELYKLPQGGVDTGETHYQAFVREVDEEVGYGVNDFILIHQLEESLDYKLPYKADIEGQRVYWFIAKAKNWDIPITKSGDWVKKGPEHSEFKDFVWMTIPELLSYDWDRRILGYRDLFEKIEELDIPLDDALFDDDDEVEQECMTCSTEASAPTLAYIPYKLVLSPDYDVAVSMQGVCVSAYKKRVITSMVAA